MFIMNRSSIAALLSLSLLALPACEKKPAVESPARDTATVATTPAPANTPPATQIVPVKPTVGIGQVVTVGAGGADLAPDFSWKGSDGTVHNLKDYRGQVVMINFWGTWCPPCRHELPDLVKVRNDNAANGFEVIGIAVNEEPTEDMTIEQHLLSFSREHNLTYPIVLASEELVAAFGEINAVPTTFVINKDGKIVDRMVGLKTEAEFSSALAKARNS